MDTYQTLLGTLTLAMGSSWASGINLYAVLLVLGIGGATDNIALPPDLQVLQDPMVLSAAAFMYFVEFFVDKTPGVDTGWDTLHTFIRIPAGAMLAASSVGDVTPALEIAAGLLGGGLAATSHVTKTSTRMLINTSPEPFSNWGASISEDLLVLGGLWTALNHPILFLVLLAVFLVAVVWLLPKMWRLIKAIFRTIGQWLGMIDKQVEAQYEQSPGPASSTQPLTAAPGSSLNELERLQQLREKGALTPEEFEQEKQKLLHQP